MATAKNEVLNWLLLKNCYSVGEMNLGGECVCLGWGGGLLGGILSSEGDFPALPKNGKSCLVGLFWKLFFLG